MADNQWPVVPGTVSWVDLTAPDAGRLRDFYCRVIGWEHRPVDMGAYSDYALRPPGAEHFVAGVCHKQGPNASLPPVWLVYFIVDNLDASLSACRELGGKVLVEPRTVGEGIFAVIGDPAGAVCALHQPTAAPQ